MGVYRVTEIIGTSKTSWEDAAREALATAARTLRDLRVAEVVEFAAGVACIEQGDGQWVITNVAVNLVPVGDGFHSSGPPST